MRRRWRAGSRRARTCSSSGSPTSPRRRAPPRPGSCSARTTTSRPSAGSRRSGSARCVLLAAGLRRARAATRRRARACSANGGASRGNLFSGGADHMILTVSRMEAERSANPGYRAFLANGFNVARTFVLFGWEVILEWSAAARERRRDVRPRGHRGGIYPFLRATMCVIVRDLIVYGVLTDMMNGRPAVYATFASYDEVAHHSGLERQDTFEALRKLDQQFARIERSPSLRGAAVRARRPLRPRTDARRDVQTAQRLRPGRVRRAEPCRRRRQRTRRWRRAEAMVGHAAAEATGRKAKPPKNDVSGRDVVVLGSGNLGLVYLMEEKGRMPVEQLSTRHPDLLPALSGHPHIGWVLARSEEHGAIGARRRRRPVPRGGPGRGRGSARALRADRGAASPPDARVRRTRRIC